MSSTCVFVLDMMIKCLDLLPFVCVTVSRYGVCVVILLYNCENKREHVIDEN